MTDFTFLHPFFLGPNAENDQLFESLVLDCLRDHAHWRRNFHPEDGNAIPTAARYSDQFLQTLANMRMELRQLGSDLKSAAPFYSPRYIGHMNSDLLIPGLIAQIMTILYNPNNVSAESGPATVTRELEVGFQLARMFGFKTDLSKNPCGWGHLCSGGTTANYEGLRNFRAVKFYPVALAEALRKRGFDLEKVGPRGQTLRSYSKWELINFSIRQVVELAQQARIQIHATMKCESAFREFCEEVEDQTIESLGMPEFFHRHTEIKPPKVIIPITAHYSWEKAMKVLGLGSHQLVQVQVDQRMRLRADHLREVLEREIADDHPILAVIGVVGSTEFSSIDPIHQIVAARQECEERGAYFGIHVDAAWGGYMASIFRRENGDFCAREEVADGFRHFPCPEIYLAFRELGQVDSITVDPHKLGYLPYPCGAFIARDMGILEFVGQKVTYLYDLKDDRDPKSRIQKLRNLGQFILEGSKPGAAAASAYVCHKLLPLHKHGFGQLVKMTILAGEHFAHKIARLANRLKDRVILRIPFMPDTNILCFTLNRKGNHSLALMNHFARSIFDNIKIRVEQPLQTKEFIGSYTALVKGKVDEPVALKILADLEINPDTFCKNAAGPQTGTAAAGINLASDHIFLFRHSLMSPLLLQKQNGSNYIDRYCDYLEQLILAELSKIDKLPTHPGVRGKTQTEAQLSNPD